jgi:hypothetical protein
MRATFITPAIEDGADPDVIETRVTHSRKARNAFDGYNRGLHCSKLRVTREPQSVAIEQSIPGPIRCLSLQSLQVAEPWRKIWAPSGGSPDSTRVVTASYDNTARSGRSD